MAKRTIPKRSLDKLDKTYLSEIDVLRHDMSIELGVLRDVALEKEYDAEYDKKNIAEARDTMNYCFKEIRSMFNDYLKERSKLIKKYNK